jgi:hypothetical protein
MRVVLLDCAENRSLELIDAAEHSTGDLLLSQMAEEAFDHVEPRGAGRGEMKMKSRMPSNPAQNDGVLVGAVVVGDQMDLFGRWRLPIDLLEELQPLLVAVPRHAATDDLTVQSTHGRKQRRGAIALVVVRHRATATPLHRQARLGPIESLDLALLIDTQDEGVLGRVEIERDDILSLNVRTR